MGSIERADDHLLTLPGLSDVEKVQVCALVGRGRGVAYALAELGKYLDDLDVAMRDDPAFVRDYQMALALRDEAVEKALHKKATKGNVTAMKFWLTNRQPDSWTETRTTRHVGHSGGAIEVSATVAALRDVMTSEETRDAAIAWIDDDVIDVEPLPAGDEPAGEDQEPGEAG
jgi:hypothetical protein